MNINRIHFEKAILSHKNIIFEWLDKPHVREFWDNSQAHRDDILSFLNDRKEPFPYYNGILTYWIGSIDDTPYCLLMILLPFVRQTGMCTLDQDLRLLHARLHTAGHLISNVIESHYPQWQSAKGHHFPDQCYVEFTAKKGAVENISIDWVNKEMEQFIQKEWITSTDQISGDQLQKLCPHINYTIPRDQPIRVIRIGDFPFSPCGGTHVKSLRELKGLKITKHKIKKNSMKIYYNIQNS